MSEAILIEPKTVLFVDDDSNILNSLKRALRTEAYESVFAGGGREALELLERRRVHVIVTDLGMPDMHGLSLLKTVEQRYPDVVPLVLSAQSDTNSVLDAVNKGHIYGYILKPWNNMELKLTVKQAIDVFNLQQEKRDLLSKLEEHNRLLDKRVRQRTKQLMAVQREAEIGRYSAQIVHNMNNPLQALYLWAERAEGLLSGNRCDLNELGEYISSIMSSANDLKTIVSSVLTHARNEDNSRTQMVNINDVIRKTLDFYKAHPIFKRQIEKQLKLSDELPPIVGNPIQIQQIMDNLVKNAVDAISAYR